MNSMPLCKVFVRVHVYIDPTAVLSAEYSFNPILYLAFLSTLYCLFVIFSTPILELSECVHTTVIKDMCADCGADLRQNENVSTRKCFLFFFFLLCSGEILKVFKESKIKLS